uniref:M48 family peptidase n=1 Tax=Desulfobacca acetoxidans TaxID=60893 RepID=A0A7V4LC83_9BACT
MVAENHEITSWGLRYRLSFSPKRRTVGLSVTPAGEVLVRAPRGMSKARVAEVVDRHRAWLEKKLAEKREAWSQLTPGAWYYRGRALQLVLVPDAGAEVRVRDGALVVPAAGSPAARMDRLRFWYGKEAVGWLRQGLAQHAPRMGLPVPRFEVRSWRRRWGECRPDRGLAFNWRLILLPPEIMDYVVVHELAHLLVPGHPPAFWQEVARHLPDYQSRRRWLRQQGAPFLLWQPRLEELGEGPGEPSCPALPPDPPLKPPLR